MGGRRWGRGARAGGDVHVAGARDVAGGGPGAVAAGEGGLPAGGAGGAAGIPRGLLGLCGLEGPIWVQPVDRETKGLR